MGSVDDRLAASEVVGGDLETASWLLFLFVSIWIGWFCDLVGLAEIGLVAAAVEEEDDRLLDVVVDDVSRLLW